MSLNIDLPLQFNLKPFSISACSTHNDYKSFSDLQQKNNETPMKYEKEKIENDSAINPSKQL